MTLWSVLRCRSTLELRFRPGRFFPQRTVRWLQESQGQGLVLTKDRQSRFTGEVIVVSYAPWLGIDQVKRVFGLQIDVFLGDQAVGARLHHRGLVLRPVGGCASSCTRRFAAGAGVILGSLASCRGGLNASVRQSDRGAGTQRLAAAGGQNIHLIRAHRAGDPDWSWGARRFCRGIRHHGFW